jgi:CRISPR-associated endonuclease/helicase Cas3
MGRFRTRCRELDEGFGLIHRMAYYAHSRPGCGHFFARKDQMDYPVKAQRDDTLLQVLGENGMAVTDARRAGGETARIHAVVCQCGQAFSCNRQTNPGGEMFPFRNEGKDLIAALSEARDLAREFQLLRQAQRFAVNVFQWEMESLTRSEAIYEVQAGTGIFVLREEFYLDEFWAEARRQ